MKMRAAILDRLNAPLSVEDVELDGPKDEEVLVKLAAAGVCHSGIHIIKGDMAVPLPVVLGHEGAGIVQEIGPERTLALVSGYYPLEKINGAIQDTLEGKVIRAVVKP